MDISQVQASLRAPHLDRHAIRFAPWKGAGSCLTTMTRQFINARIHRPIRGASDCVPVPGGRARGRACPRLMSIVPPGPSRSNAAFAPPGPWILARCKRACERGAWTATHHDSRPGRAAEHASPKTSFIKFDPASLQHFLILLLKRSPAMMLLLPTDVMGDLFEIRGADRERAITLLPGEAGHSNLLMNPFRRRGFEIAHHIGQTMGGPESDQQMNVIPHPANRFGDTSRRSNHAAQVSVQTVTPCGVNQDTAFFGAENEVVMEAQMGRGHTVSLQGMFCTRSRVVNAQIHRPVRGALGFGAGTGGCARGLACPRLMSIAPSGRSCSWTISAPEGPARARIVPAPEGPFSSWTALFPRQPQAASAPEGPWTLARCKRACERRTWTAMRYDSRPGRAPDHASRP